jgi:hypothetical protein
MQQQRNNASQLRIFHWAWFLTLNNSFMRYAILCRLLTQGALDLVVIISVGNEGIKGCQSKSGRQWRSKQNMGISVCVGSSCVAQWSGVAAGYHGASRRALLVTSKA